MVNFLTAIFQHAAQQTVNAISRDPFRVQDLKEDRLGEISNLGELINNSIQRERREKVAAEGTEKLAPFIEHLEKLSNQTDLPEGFSIKDMFTPGLDEDNNPAMNFEVVMDGPLYISVLNGQYKDGKLEIWNGVAEDNGLSNPILDLSDPQSMETLKGIATAEFGKFIENYNYDFKAPEQHSNPAPAITPDIPKP